MNRTSLLILVLLALPARAADDAPAPLPPVPAGAKVATFAGGCFWCMESPFDALPGVRSTTSGYTGGSKQNPTYEEVSAGATGHAESVRVVFDPGKVSYETLLDTFWHNIDPLAQDRQFCDRGNQYRSAIFVHDAGQRRAAEASRAKLASSKKLGGEIATQIVDAGPFYPAEEYHQDYATRNPVRYNYYRYRCGRDARLKEVWGADAPAH